MSVEPSTKVNSAAIAERQGANYGSYQFKCPNCDGELIFDSETQKYKCEYCGSKFTQAELDALQPAESKEMNAGAADGSDEAEQETTEQQSADTKKKRRGGWRRRGSHL